MTLGLTEKLRPHVDAIKADAANGDVRAKEIITLYKMWERCPNDAAAPALCEATFDDWLKRKEKKNEEQ